ncbi:MAG: YceI family protein [Bacteroidetes bacterium]|nr:YceI family protein [Bacteroidota bacterium]
MKKMFILIAAILTMTFSAVAQTTWLVDNVHSNVKFSVTHLVISEVEGSFNVYSGTLQSLKPDFVEASVDFVVDVPSINTDNSMRDKHLKSDDFFNAEKYPKITFKSVSWKKVDDKNYVLEGDLTIRDVKKRVTFAVVHGGTIKDPWGNTKAGFKASTVINRFDYSLKWNTLMEAGGATVGKDVSITLNLEFAQKKSS